MYLSNAIAYRNVSLSQFHPSSQRKKHLWNERTIAGQPVIYSTGRKKVGRRFAGSRLMVVSLHRACIVKTTSTENL